MINLNIQKTYSNAYAKKTGMQNASGNLNNLKQDTVSFNGWFSKKPPEILVNQETYDKISKWAGKADNQWDTNFMKYLKKLCEGDLTEDTTQNAGIFVREITDNSKEEIKQILIDAYNTAKQPGLKSTLSYLLEGFGKGPLK